MKDTHSKLSLFSVFLHWIIGIAVIAMLAMGLYMESLPRSDFKWNLYGIHKSIGVLVLAVASTRALWRIYNGMPTFMAGVVLWQKYLATFVHWLLLAGTLAMPISGVIMVITRGDPVMLFGLELATFPNSKDKSLNEVAHTIHSIGGKVMVAAIVIHLLATIKHHFIAKNNIVRRMLGGSL